MESMLITFLISPFLFFTSLYLLKLLKPNKQNLPPSPPKLPIIGNLHQLGTLPHRSLQALSAKYGPLMLLHLGKVPTLVVSSAEMVKEILKAHQDVIFAGRPQTRVADSLFYGCTDMAFCPYGEYWRQVRKIGVLELLSQKRVQEFQFVREEEVAKMVEKIQVSCQDGVAVDLSEMILTVSNNIVSRSALGRVFEQDGDDKSVGALSRKAIDLISAFSFKDLFPSLGWLDNLTGLVATLRDTSKALHDALDQVIEEHDVCSSDDKSDKKDLVDILLSLQKSGMLDMDLTQDNLKAILMIKTSVSLNYEFNPDLLFHVIVAGHVCWRNRYNGSSMEWAMAEIVKNPSVMKKAQEEVRRVVGHKSKMSEADINQMGYLKCVLKETLRLHAPAMIMRETSSSAKLDGYDIPPKTRVLINAWAIQRDPNVWDKPEEFIPERFVDTSIDYKDQSGKFIPFGGGRRGCPGMSFGLAEAEFVLANILYWFNCSPLENVDMTEAESFIVHLKKPLLVVPMMYSP